MSLADFLLARIAEDEEAAKRAGSASWQHRSLYRHPESSQSVYAEDREIAEVDHTDGWHIARHDPARVLAECQAKRQIVEELGDYGDGYIWAASEASRAQAALEALALPYADHPDYQEKWKP